MVIFDASISALPFELLGNELLLKSLIKRFPNAFRRIASLYESGEVKDHTVYTPDKRGLIHFSISGDAIGIRYSRIALSKHPSFSDAFNTLFNIQSDSRPSLIQRAVSEAASQNQGIGSKDTET